MSNRTELTVQDGRRLDRLMRLCGVEHGTCGPDHEPYGMETAVFDVTSPLARFLMRKGVFDDGITLGVDNRRWFTQYEVDVAHAWESARYAYGMGARTWRIRRVSV